MTMAFLALLVAAPMAFAQNIQKVTIEDGKVFIDGKEVAQKNLPPSLHDLESDMFISFWSDADALVEINGNVFSIENGRILEADSDFVDEGNVSVFFSTDEGQKSAFRVFQKSGLPANTYVLAPHANQKAMQSYVTALNDQAHEMVELKLELQDLVPEGNAVARQLVVEAENAARIAQAFPRVQFESYLGQVQGRDQDLYKELLREREMEMRTHQLARQIRSAETRQQQEDLTEELRAALTEIFQLKQENRQEEIEQLSQQLKELRSRLDERESLRKDIIESRLKDLLEQHRW